MENKDIQFHITVKEMDLLLMIVMDMLVLLILVKEKNVLVFLDT